MRYDFRSAAHADASSTIVPALVDPWAVFQSKTNIEQDEWGVHMWCRNGAGAGFMLKQQHTYGLWQVRSRISPGLANPTTKTCLLLWAPTWPPELDFNESGDRDWSHQTLHWGEQVNGRHPEIHTSYPIDQRKFHTYGVDVQPTTVSYFCDGILRGAVANMVPGTLWNLHVRTEPKLDTESETKQDVRWLEVPD